MVTWLKCLYWLVWQHAFVDAIEAQMDSDSNDTEHSCSKQCFPEIVQDVFTRLLVG